ncbi:MAG: lipopolysaccharide heptosyltransferase II [Candidatus Kapaibacterium sp.]
MKILILRLSSLGDIILTTPLIQELRAKYPEARIDLVLKKEYTGIADHFPWLSHIFALDTTKGTSEIQRLNGEFKKIGFDHVLDLHNNFRSRRLRRGLGGSLHVIDKRTFKRWFLIKTKINLLKNEPDIIGRYFETAKSPGITDTGTGATFGKEFLRSPAKKAALCPGAKHWNKRWLPEYYVEVAKDLIAKGFQIEFFGSAEENEYVGSIASQLPQDKVTNLCGKLSLAELPGRMAECSLAITNDSGLMHVASAVGMPTIAIFGPTVREFGFMPRNTNVQIVENLNLDCRPCTTIGLDHCPKGHFKCMKEIVPSVVFSIINK